MRTLIKAATLAKYTGRVFENASETVLVCLYAGTVIAIGEEADREVGVLTEVECGALILAMLEGDEGGAEG